jgi:hypothetical protein
MLRSRTLSEFGEENLQQPFVLSVLIISAIWLFEFVSDFGPPLPSALSASSAVHNFGCGCAALGNPRLKVFEFATPTKEQEWRRNPGKRSACPTILVSMQSRSIVWRRQIHLTRTAFAARESIQAPRR